MLEQLANVVSDIDLEAHLLFQKLVFRDLHLAEDLEHVHELEEMVLIVFDVVVHQLLKGKHSVKQYAIDCEVVLAVETNPFDNENLVQIVNRFGLVFDFILEVVRERKKNVGSPYPSGGEFAKGHLVHIV